MKKFLILGLGLACALLVAAGEKEKSNKLIMSNAYYTSPYGAALNVAALAKAEELGFDLQILDGEANQQKQLEQARLAVSEAAGFIYFPADVAGSGPIVDLLNRSALPYLIVNNYTFEAMEKNNVPYYVGADIKRHGHNIASLVKELLPNGGNIVAIEGTAGHAQTIAFNEAMEEDFAGTGITFLDRQPADFDADKALNKMNDFLIKYGEKIDLIISHDSGMLAGVLASLRSAGKVGEIPVVTAGSHQLVRDAIAAKEVYGTSTQDTGLEGALAIATLVKIINGEKVESWTKLPMEPVTRNGIEQVNWWS